MKRTKIGHYPADELAEINDTDIEAFFEALDDREFELVGFSGYQRVFWAWSKAGDLVVYGS